MGEHQEIRLPDVGDFEDVDVAEILVAAGDEVATTKRAERAPMAGNCLRMSVGLRKTNGTGRARWGPVSYPATTRYLP